MQRIIGLLTFIIFMALPAGDCHAAVSSKAVPVASEQGNIDDTIKTSIESLAARLHDCRFELPQSNMTSLTRQGKQHTANRRINDSSKSGEPLMLLQHNGQHTTFARTCRTAIAASHHIRGYYIYALRHIII
ncbi:MAG: hypothetical protein IJ513_08120 [Bacteroidaceae bacterium]|nr:hypothetical protein [Bacteroidaceae bacterium]